MNRYRWLLISFLLFMPMPSARCEWISLSKSLQELDIHSLSSDLRNPSIILAASQKRVYKSVDAGESWKQVMTVRGSGNQIRSIYMDQTNPGRIYVSTDRGIYRSENFGKKWDLFFQGIGSGQNLVYAVCARSERQKQFVFAATAEGLFQIDASTKEAQRVEGLPKTAVYSVDEIKGAIFVPTEEGIYKGSQAGGWDKVYEVPRSEKPGASLEQFDVEEMPTASFFSKLAYTGQSGLFFAATRQGVLEGSKEGQKWDYLKSQPFKKINGIAAGPETFYTATDTGIYRWDPQGQRFDEIYKGLESNQVNTVYFNPGGDYLLAGTKAGVFKYLHPELNYAKPVMADASLSHEDVLKKFENEPTIFEVQNAAIHYAEVYPSKIEEWRKAASRKALLPTLSFSRSISNDENVDIDRGGTADPDRFISGPVENSYDWSVNLNWNLSEMIWNDDQTSIDTRSRLMVELRDDMLSKVTHLYYERRRLQIDIALSPKKDLPLEIENIIKLQELTAGIDALTGGFFSRELCKKHAQ